MYVLAIRHFSKQLEVKGYFCSDLENKVPGRTKSQAYTISSDAFKQMNVAWLARGSYVGVYAYLCGSIALRYKNLIMNKKLKDTKILF